MFRSRLFWLPVILAGMFGYMAAQRHAKAAIPPPPCTRYECKTIYAVWDPDYGTTVVISMQVVGKTDNTNNAWEGVFATTSAEKLPYTSSGNCDVWKWTACTPTCGKSTVCGSNPPADAWQTPQEVVVTGDGALYTSYSPLGRAVCSSAPGGNGVPWEAQCTTNDGPYNPPGN